MKKVLKWIGILLGAVLILVILVVSGLAVYANTKFKPTLADRPLYPISADTSPEGTERGVYLMENAMLCTEACHNTEGKPPLSGYIEEINDGPMSAVFAVPNLTPDDETGLGKWSDAEIARAIREGVDKDGVGLMIMPAHNYHVLSDQDVAAIVGYLRGLEPVQNQVPAFEANLPARILNALGAFGPSPIGEPITTAQSTPEPGTVEYGAYMMRLGDCSACHGSDLAGGPLPMAPPDAVEAANLTPGGELAGWNEGQFIAAVVGGFKPDGTPLDDEMPRYRMNEEDLRAIFAYLKTIPAVQSGQ